MTWPDLVLSMEQSGMILDSCTIQLLILSRRRRSTVGQVEDKVTRREITKGPRVNHLTSPFNIKEVPNPSRQRQASHADRAYLHYAEPCVSHPELSGELLTS